LVSHTKGRIQIEDIYERGAEENIWAQEGESGRRLQKNAA